MHILVLEESLGESWTRNVCDDLWMLSLAPPADSMGTPGFHGWMVRAGFEIGGNLQEVCSRRNPEPGRAGPSRAVRISPSGCSGVGPHNSHGRALMTRLKIYSENEHPHEAQNLKRVN